MSKTDISRLCFGLILIFALGCSSGKFKPDLNEDSSKVQVMTDPPGAEVWFNANYIGRSPVTVDKPVLELLPDRTRYLPVYVYASPQRGIAGQCDQRIMLFNQTQVPNNMLFQMNKCE
jgi:hypothetical protein